MFGKEQTSPQKPPPRWKVVGKSVVGAIHIREGKPCQDAIQWEEGDTFAILAVADGHGSKHSPYSDQGAQIAVEVAVDFLFGLYRQSRSSPLSLSAMKHYVEEQLPQALVRKWIERVKAHHATDTGHEEPPKQDLLVEYGSTLLATLIVQDFLLFLQLGDGDILVVADDGAVRPLPKDEHLIANETTSLSTPYAWREMRVGWILTPDDFPGLVLLSTDGYANSFVSKQDFLKVGADVLELSREQGIEWVASHLEEWLNDASMRGSGDDITVGLAFRIPSGE